MVFNSLQFVVFFLPFFAGYLLLRSNLSKQNLYLLIASYVFYAVWDWRFLALLIGLSIACYGFGLAIGTSKNSATRGKWLTAAVCFHLLILCVFKYFNFFAESLFGLFHWFGWEGHYTTLRILLPLGISFYIFKAIGYCVDVSREHLKPEKNFPDLALYIAFFPQLISGPIDRAIDLLPQIQKKRDIDWNTLSQGAYLVFWGLFQKVFVADNLAALVSPVFDTPGPHAGSQILIASYIYSFQLYFDFAGYSHMAWGIAKLMGFETTHNFNLPFFAPNIQGFWNRWHISLSRWIRDYLYTPLFLSGRFLKGNWRLYWATLLSMFCMGLWHGAGWHFVLFGVYHGLLLCLYVAMRPFLQKIVIPKSKWAQRLWLWARLIFMFQLTTFGFLIFRAHSCQQIFDFTKALLSGFQMPAISLGGLFPFVFFAGVAIVMDCFQSYKEDRFFIFKWPVLLRAGFYVICFYWLSLFGARSGQEFIYFQF